MVKTYIMLSSFDLELPYSTG